MFLAVGSTMDRGGGNGYIKSVKREEVWEREVSKRGGMKRSRYV